MFFVVVVVLFFVRLFFLEGGPHLHGKPWEMLRTFKITINIAAAHLRFGKHTATSQSGVHDGSKSWTHVKFVSSLFIDTFWQIRHLISGNCSDYMIMWAEMLYPCFPSMEGVFKVAYIVHYVLTCKRSTFEFRFRTPC